MVMSRTRSAKWIAIVTLSFGSSCIITDCSSTMGGPCEDSSDCDDPRNVGVCVPRDDDPDDAICVPAAPRDPTPCDEDDDCIDESFPIDAECKENVCTCPVFSGDCVDTAEGSEFSETLCACTFGDLKPTGDLCGAAVECLSS